MLLKSILRGTLLFASAFPLTGCADSYANNGGGAESGPEEDASLHPETERAGGTPPRTPREPKVCQGTAIQASALSLPNDYDYLALRALRNVTAMTNPRPFETQWDSWREWSVHSEVGELCVAASDEAACIAAVNAIPTDLAETNYFQISAVTTRGDQVKRWAGRNSIQELLGKIDSSDEAKLWALIAGYDVCEDPAVSAVAEGYELNASQVYISCGVNGVTGVVLQVDPRGAIEEVATTLFPSGKMGCEGPEGPALTESHAQHLGTSALPAR